MCLLSVLVTARSHQSRFQHPHHAGYGRCEELLREGLHNSNLSGYNLGESRKRPVSGVPSFDSVFWPMQREDDFKMCGKCTSETTGAAFRPGNAGIDCPIRWRGSLTASVTATLALAVIALSLIPTVSATAIMGGYRSFCMLHDDGAPWCWGDNSNRQLMGGSTSVASYSVPTWIPIQLTAMSTGSYHTCGITPAATLQCWGSNGKGQLGDGTLSGRPGPPLVRPDIFSNVIAVSCGSSYTCALRAVAGTPPSLSDVS